MISWKKILTYGLFLFAVQFVIGMAAGFFSPGTSSLFSSGDIAAFFAGLAIFTHLSIRQTARTLLHAFLVLSVYWVLSIAAGVMLSPLLGHVPFLLIALEWLSLFVAMVAGMMLGLFLRHRKVSA